MAPSPWYLINGSKYSEQSKHRKILKSSNLSRQSQRKSLHHLYIISLTYRIKSQDLKVLKNPIAQPLLVLKVPVQEKVVTVKKYRLFEPDCLAKSIFPSTSYITSDKLHNLSVP